MSRKHPLPWKLSGPIRNGGIYIHDNFENSIAYLYDRATAEQIVACVNADSGEWQALTPEPVHTRPEPGQEGGTI